MFNACWGAVDGAVVGEGLKEKRKRRLRNKIHGRKDLESKNVSFSQCSQANALYRDA